MAEGAIADVFRYGHPVHVRRNSVEASTVIDVVELGVEVGVNKRRGLLENALVRPRLSRGLDKFNDVIQVAAQRGLKQRALVREVLVERAHGDASALRDEGCSELLFPNGDQNLKSGLQDGVDRHAGTRLNRHFSWL